MHKIENISFQIEIHKNETQQAYEKKYVSFLKYRFLPKVEELFDKWNMAYPNIKCTIEEIALNINEEEINEEELQKKLIRQLSIQLAKINVVSPEKTKDIKVSITIEPSKIDAFIQYLATGSLPNYSTIKEIKRWLLKTVKFSKKEKEKIKQVIHKDFNSFRRLATVLKKDNYDRLKIVTNENTNLIPKEFIQKIVQLLITQLQLKRTKTEIEIWINKLQNTNTTHELSKKIIELFKEKEQQIPLNEVELEELNLKLIYAKFQFENAKTIEKNLFEELKIIPKLKMELQKNSKSKVTEEQEKSILNEEPNKDSKNKVKEEEDRIILNEKTDKSKRNKDAIEIDKSIEKKVAKENNTVTNKINSESRKTNKKVKIVTEKAGLVILHPFIKELLKSATLLTEENKIKDTNKAVLMLHYLATGNQKALDLELSFEKILLGIPIEEVITIPQKLTKIEKHQCDALLKAVVQHWNIYKSNATNSLRSMFLQRFGTVDYTKKKITIEVEKQAQDLLLDKLPWGIGIIKLPWLKPLIYTKW